MTRKDWLGACGLAFVATALLIVALNNILDSQKHALECIDRLTQHVEVLYLNYSTLSDVVWDEHGGD